MRCQLIFVQVGYADRRHLRCFALIAPVLHVDGKHTVKVTMHECEGPLTVWFVSLLIHIFNNQHVIDDSQILAIKSLAAYISNTNEYVVPLNGVRNPPDQLRLGVKQHKLMLILQVIESNATHGTSMAHILARQVNCCDWVCKSRLNQLDEFSS